MNLKPVVYDHFEATKKSLDSELNKYRDLIVTDTKQAKKVRAGLNKLVKNVDDRKKELKRPYVDAYKGMEQQANDLKSMIHEVKEPIDAQIKTIEMGEKMRRETRMKDLIASMAFSQYAPQIRKSVRDGLLGMADVVGRVVINPKTGGRGVILQGNDGIFAKNRLDNRTSAPIEELYSFGTEQKEPTKAKEKAGK